MSSWILGSEMAASLGLRDFEFAREYVAKGLKPHTQQGEPFRPAEVARQFITGLEQEMASHENLAWNLTGFERDEIIANQIQPLHDRIQSYWHYFASIQDYTWEGFVLPEDPDLSAHFISTLINSFYLEADVEKLIPAPAKPAVEIHVEAPVRPQNLRPVQKHKIDCRAAAQKIWAESPGITIQDMIQGDEIANACEGIVYGEKTIRNWIKDLCPNRKPGRPKTK